MKMFRIALSFIAVLAMLAVPALPNSLNRVANAASACASSSPASAAYTVTVCLTAPASGSTLTGATTVTATASVTGTNPGVQRMIFYLNGAYMLTDYQSLYTFSLPTTRLVDGSYSLSVGALMRDGFNTSKASETVQFSNGITTAPVNNNTFTPTSGTSPAAGAPFVVMAAGDGAGGEANATKVVNLIAQNNPNLFLYLGDVYEKGAPVEFYNWYGPIGSGNFYDRFRSITDPTIGNHEYTSSSNAAGYFDYWNNIPNYYSFNAGGWHFISLNANSSKIGVGTTSPQYQWLQKDLIANSSTCTIVYYHEPLYNIGSETPQTTMAPIWALMAQYGVSIVLNGHDHDYQRWLPLDGSGNLSSTGITEFIAGGGGHGVQAIPKTDSRVAYSNAKNPDALGALKLSLTSSGAAFSYLSVTGTTLDSGTIPCNKSGAANIQPSSAPAESSATSAKGAGQNPGQASGAEKSSPVSNTASAMVQAQPVHQTILPAASANAKVSSPAVTVSAAPPPFIVWILRLLCTLTSAVSCG